MTCGTEEGEGGQGGQGGKDEERGKKGENVFPFLLFTDETYSSTSLFIVSYNHLINDCLQRVEAKRDPGTGSLSHLPI